MHWLDPSWWLTQIVDWISHAILNSFDAMFSLIAGGLLTSPDVTTLPQIQALIGRSVLIVDTVFVLAFITAGVLTMTSGGDERARYTAKDLGPRLVVGFIAAHFSPLLVGRAVGLANGLVAGLTPGDPNRAGALQAIKSHVDVKNGATTILLYPVLAAIITVLLAGTLFGMLVRFAVLLVLAAAAPLALACHALPQTDPVARLWWRSFAGCLAIPVLQAFTLQAGQWMLEDPAHMLPLLGLPFDPTPIMNLFIVVVLLWTTVKIPGLVRRNVTKGGKTPNALGTIVRVVVMQQITRGIGRGGSRVVKAVAR